MDRVYGRESIKSACQRAVRILFRAPKIFFPGPPTTRQGGYLQSNRILVSPLKVREKPRRSFHPINSWLPGSIFLTSKAYNFLFSLILFLTAWAQTVSLEPYFEMENKKKIRSRFFATYGFQNAFFTFLPVRPLGPNFFFACGTSTESSRPNDSKYVQLDPAEDFFYLISCSKRNFSPKKRLFKPVFGLFSYSRWIFLTCLVGKHSPGDLSPFNMTFLACWRAKLPNLPENTVQQLDSLMESSFFPSYRLNHLFLGIISLLLDGLHLSKSKKSI